MISREEAYKIAIQYLGEQMLGKIKIDEKVPDGVYLTEENFDAWVVHVPQMGRALSVGATRVLCISKISGKIVRDQFVGE